MNNLETERYQMLAIRNSAASEASTSAAQTSRAGSSPDNGVRMDREFVCFSAGDGFIRLRSFTEIGPGIEKGFGFPKPLFKEARELT